MRPAKSRELLEWMGMTRADFCVYAAIASLVAMFFVCAPAIDLAVAVTAISFAITACYWGMKSDPEFEDITNLFKAVTYPAALLFVALVIAVHYVLILSGHADYAGFGVWHAVERVNHFFQNAPANF